MPRGCSCALILLSAPQVMGNNSDVHDLNDLSTSRFGPSSVGFFYGKQRLWHWKYFCFLFCFIHDARRLHKYFKTRMKTGRREKIWTLYLFLLLQLHLCVVMCKGWSIILFEFGGEICIALLQDGFTVKGKLCFYDFKLWLC